MSAKKSSDGTFFVERWYDFLGKKVGPPGGLIFVQKKRRIAILLSTCASRKIFGPKNWPTRRAYFLAQKNIPSLHQKLLHDVNFWRVSAVRLAEQVRLFRHVI